MAELSSYQDLVHAAFIKPLRSVMIIDDDYPTWEEIFDRGNWTEAEDGTLGVPKTPKSWVKTPDLPKNLISRFRKHDKGLLIDIDDGKPPAPSTTEIANHLYQSDILGLDYQIEGEGIGGDRAIGIAASLLTQGHFNLIVVHTNKEDLDDPFSQILMRLLTPCEEDDRAKTKIERAKNALEELEDEGEAEGAEALTETLKGLFRSKHYLLMRHPSGDATKKLMRGEAPFTEIKNAMEMAGLEARYRDSVLAWLCFDFQKRYAHFSDVAHSLQWSLNDNCLWIRSERGFITFANKKNTTDLIEALQTALEDWQPTPSRLLSSVYRHALSDYGVSVEDSTLANKHIFARFYDDILNAENEPQQQTLLRQHIRQQTEQIGAAVEDDVAKFGLDIVRLDSPEAPFSAHYNVDLSNADQAKKATFEFNNYVSSIDVHGHHLTSGHIFELDGKKWVVVSPACDLVPGQKRMGFHNPNSKHRPFIAVELHP
ncbi:hypothetical protein C7293_31550, partial [filamentous cyanobacterium CCT1]